MNITEQMIAKAADAYTQNIRKNKGQSNMGTTALSEWIGCTEQEARQIRLILIDRKIIKHLGNFPNHYREDEISLGYDGKRPSARTTPYWGVGETALPEPTNDQ